MAEELRSGNQETHDWKSYWCVFLQAFILKTMILFKNNIYNGRYIKPKLKIKTSHKNKLPISKLKTSY